MFTVYMFTSLLFFVYAFSIHQTFLVSVTPFEQCYLLSYITIFYACIHLAIQSLYFVYFVYFLFSQKQVFDDFACVRLFLHIHELSTFIFKLFQEAICNIASQRAKYMPIKSITFLNN